MFSRKDYGALALELAKRPQKLRDSISTISRGKYYSAISDGTNVDLTYQSKHEVLADCHGLSLLYGNFFQDERTTGLAPFTLKVSVYVNGANYPMFFDNGNVSKRFDLGAMGRTDSLGITLKKGDMIFVRTHVKQEPGEKHPRGLLLFSSPNNEGYTLGDTTSTAGAVVPVAGTLYGLTPLALFANPSPSADSFKTLGICGSSSSTGTGRGNTVLEGHPQGDIGFLQIGAMRAGWGYVTIGQNGQKASDFAEPLKRRNRVQMTKDCDLVIIQYASNDLSDSKETFESIKENLLRVHGAFWDMGIPTAQVTVNPRTNSTDGWTTLVNQTPINANFAPGPNSTRGRLNAWIMKNDDGVRGIDTNMGWESSKDSGLWRVDSVCTSDGIHPNTFGHDNAAANAVRDFLLRQ